MSKIDKILKAFNKAVIDLEVHVDVKLKSAASHQQKINKLYLKKSNDEVEVARALGIAKKLKEIIA
jgi:hypothetical protein